MNLLNQCLRPLTHHGQITLVKYIYDMIHKRDCGGSNIENYLLKPSKEYFNFRNDSLRQPCSEGTKITNCHSLSWMLEEGRWPDHMFQMQVANVQYSMLKWRDPSERMRNFGVNF